MRKTIIAALAATMLIPSIAGAQSYGEVRRDAREVRGDQRDLRDAYQRGDRGDIRDARRELREDRRETREDWRDYRRTHADVYRRGGYAAPRGYRYRPVTVGYRFAPEYYSQRYWINDPYTFRLSRPSFSYQRWVRYGNDVVLVDTRNGRTVQVYNSFFF